MKKRQVRDFFTVHDSKKLKLCDSGTLVDSDDHDHVDNDDDDGKMHLTTCDDRDENISSDDFILPIEIKLYILEFIQFPLARYTSLSEAGFWKELRKITEVRNVNLNTGWKIARKIVRDRMIKAMFGYFVGKVTNLVKEREVHQLYKHVNYEYVGIWGQDEFYSNLRFRDLKSIEFSNDYSFACKFDYWSYMPNLESIIGLNIELEGHEEKFINNVNRDKLTSISFANAKGKLINDGKRFFQSLPNLTRLKVSPAYASDIMGLEKLKHLTFTEGTMGFDNLRSIIEKSENLETIDVSQLKLIASPDRVFTSPKKKINLKSIHATKHGFTHRVFTNLIRSVNFLPNLTDLRIGIAQTELFVMENFTNYCREYSNIEHISLKGFEFTAECFSEMQNLKKLKSIRDATLRSCEELANIPSLKILTIDPKCNHSIDFSPLHQLEGLSTVASLSLLRNFKDSNFLPRLGKLSLEIQNELAMDSISNEFLTLGTFRPHLIIHLSIAPLISEDNYHNILSCPLIENLHVKCNQIPESIQFNTTLKKLTQHVNSLFIIPDHLASNQTIEEIRIYGMDPNFMISSSQELFDFVEKSKATYISFVDPDRVGFIDKGEHDPDVLLW
ncbi:predicted protein [Naegleria gruberi]|uniref:Predicted protein n=1 Tax=Naegleria gruberi TaxID=5762 RepID=D2V058_NAEGR|nr:uncharacterized protein NAEGRDRAFT_45627 [Naegleria gruberi]EFC49471.1 predicted protein [Naegleria gruberi]|eukprot:XP_002682215.1 predicted protein [Naegleria gruberi strain NEG-M]